MAEALTVASPHPAHPAHPPAVDGGEFDKLREYLLEQSHRCARAPQDRFDHPWLSPMPLSAQSEAVLRSRASPGATTPPTWRSTAKWTAPGV